MGSYRSFVTPSADHCVPVLLPVETSSVMHGMHPRTRDLVIEGMLRVLVAVSLMWTPDFALQRINVVLYLCGQVLATRRVRRLSLPAKCFVSCSTR